MSCLVTSFLGMGKECVISRVSGVQSWGNNVSIVVLLLQKCRYAHDKDFGNMLATCCAETAEAISFVAAALLRIYGQVPGCLNIGVGGKDVPSL